MLSNFTYQFPLSKTLRFELKPMGRTLEHIHKKNFLQQDAALAQYYQELKRVIDDYHRDFIEQALASVQLARLDEFADTLKNAKQNSKDEKARQALQKAQDELRAQIVKQFTAGENKEKFNRLFKKELFKGAKGQVGDLAIWIAQHDYDSQTQREQDLALVEQFKDFTTYFTNFHDARKNIYSAEAEHTAIAYRLVHENLPRFLDNAQILANIREQQADLYQQISQQLPTLKLQKLSAISPQMLQDAKLYQQLLTQTGIDDYNALIGGISAGSGEQIIEGINQLINQHNQTNRTKIPKLKMLYKQILSDKQSLSFLPQQFADDGQLCEAVSEFYRHNAVNFKKINALFAHISDYDAHGIYVARGQISTLSQRVFADFSLLNKALAAYYAAVIEPEFAKKIAKAKSEQAKEKLIKTQNDFVKSDHSIATLQDALQRYAKELDDAQFSPDAISAYLADFSVNETNLVQRVENLYSTIKGFLERERATGERLLQKQKQTSDVKALKAFLDSVLELNHFVKLLAVGKSALQLDERFYGEFDEIYQELSGFSTLYNKVRDYIAQKPYSTQKYPLNFGNATLLDGWDANKEKDNFGVILRKDGLYYLALLDKLHKRVFEQAPTPVSQNRYEKMVYKLLPGPNKMLPKVFFAKSNIDFYQPSQQLLERYQLGTHKKSENFRLQDCHALIDFFKTSIGKRPEWCEFGFQFSDTSSYQDLSGFYKEVEAQGYRIKFTDIDAAYIDDLVEQGKLYLFQIYNKDFSPHAHGNKNLHTLYFEQIFDAANLAAPIFKLNGQAQLFFRKASLRLEDTAVHPAGEALQPKNPDRLPTDTRTLPFDVIKNRRYTQDKFLFHVPITLNFGAQDITHRAFNEKVNALYQQTPKTCIIGIDRGERHLLYVSVIDEKGALLEPPISLNSIAVQDKNGQLVCDKKGNQLPAVPYHTLLANREKARTEARMDWGEIEGIRELKAGYLSQVVHHIAQLLRRYLAQGYAPMIALEDLNFGFKRGRFKVEKQVYQNFENALIKKLNFLVFKDAQAGAGSVRQALQLTNKFEEISKIGKQTGIVFYLPAANTSKIDPATGFVDLLRPRYENVAKSQAWFAKFDRICYNARSDYFEFHTDLTKFTDAIGNAQARWTICSYGDTRHVYDPKTQKAQPINVTEQLKSVFDAHGIEYQSGRDLVADICAIEEKSLHSTLIFLLKTLLMLRYTKPSTGKKPTPDEDFILSPVADARGVFFDSRRADKCININDADANGAYHIALKGLWALRQIQAAEDLSHLALHLGNKDWLYFAQHLAKNRKK